MGTDMSSSGLSRRDLLAGAVAAGAVAALPSLARAGGKGLPLAKGTAKPVVEKMLRRTHHTVSALDPGWALVAGGFTGGKPATSTLLVDLVGGELRKAGRLRTARARHASVTLKDGRVLVLGGVNKRVLASVEAYDPMTDKWYRMPDMASPRADFTVVEVDGGLMLLGGSGANGPLGLGFYSL